MKPDARRKRDSRPSHSKASELKIVTNTSWPAFRNVASDVQKAIRPFRTSVIIDSNKAEAGGDILFIETIRKDTLKSLRRLLPSSNIVFYGTTEGHSLLDVESLRIAKKITVVAVSGFVKQMLEEVDVAVAGVVHHGIDMDEKQVDAPFLQSLKNKTGGKPTALTIASNDPRKGLKKLLQAYSFVEKKISKSFLILHSEPKRYFDDRKQKYKEGYYDLPELVSRLRIQNIWLTSHHGHMTNEEINAFYHFCHIYVLSSFSEGFGLPVLEAFRFNKPVIAVDAPPFNEIIENGRSGILIPCEKVRWFNYKNKIRFKMHLYKSSHLAEAAINLLTDEELRKRMNSYIKARKHRWNFDRVYPELLEYF